MTLQNWYFLFKVGFVFLFSYQCFAASETISENREIAFKLTPSYYLSSDSNDALDLNLRGTVGVHTGWIAFYQNKALYQQTRTGYEFHQEFEFIRSVWSA